MWGGRGAVDQQIADNNHHSPLRSQQAVQQAGCRMADRSAAAALSCSRVRPGAALGLTSFSARPDRFAN